MMAAAKYGKGKVILFSHSSYSSGFPTTNSDASVRTLHSNILNWVAGTTNASQIVYG